MDKKTLRQAEKAGNSTDTVVGHLTTGEVIIPKNIFEIPEVKKVIKSAFQENGISLNEFIVGNSENKINMDTGYPEFWNPISAVVNAAKGFLGIGGGGGGGGRSGPSKAELERMEKERKEAEARMVAQGLQGAKDKSEKDVETYKKSREEMAKREQEQKEKEAEFQATSARDAALRAQTQPGNVANIETDVAAVAPPAQKKLKAGGFAGVTGMIPYSAIKSMNEESGGTSGPVNRFSMPSTEGIVFGGA